MGVDTEIAWCDHTFNPWWGCQRVSPGCENCYAESFAKRVGHGKRLPMIWGPASTTERQFFGDAHWNEPRKWNAKAERDGVRRRVFCASMADVFEDREDLVAPRERLFRLIDGTPHLDWLLLTKRPENVNRLTPLRLWGTLYNRGLPPNVWIGTTVEDQKRAHERVPELLKVHARVRFLSCEPLLEPVTLRLSDWGSCFHEGREGSDDQANHRECASHLDWIIIGGESGGGSRPFDLAWARSIRDQCKAAGVACFVKQMGSSPRWSPEGEQWWKGPHTNGDGAPRFADRKGGDIAEWPEDLRVREWPTVTP